jgi:transcription elongation factor Elf1
MLFIDAKYTEILGSRLRNFAKKKDYLWNYSCPVCGDSSKNKLKARGYIYRKKNDLFSKCHNCGSGLSLGNLIKYVDPHLYDEYVLERYKEGATGRMSHKKVDPTDFFKDDNVEEVKNTLQFNGNLEEGKVSFTDSNLDGLVRVDTLPETHPVYRWVENRRIPKERYDVLYLATKFKEYVNTITPKFAEPIKDEHPRLIIPFFNEHGKMIAFQGRAFGKETPKYYTIKVDEDSERIYGLDRVDYSKKIYVTEGPIDSLFLPNAIAVSGSSFDTPFIQGIKSVATIVMDNEPRSKEITKLLDKYIELGYNVCLWSDTITEKDINDMVLSGKTPSEIIEVINTNTFSGAEAKLRFSKWKKI